MMASKRNFLLRSDLLGPAQRQLYEVAMGMHGIVTARDARALGIDGAVLRMLHRRGGLERLSRGVYRFPEMPAGPLDQYAAAVHWPVGVMGVLSHRTALDLHDICDVNAVRVDLTVPAGYALNPRREPPAHMRLWREALPAGDVTRIEGLPIVTPVRAIVECQREGIAQGLIDQATATLRERGTLTDTDRRRLDAARDGTAAT
jgi:predicted transcriptional regulator of viral defense system